MQFFTSIADALCKRFFDKGMNIFRAFVDCKRARKNIFEYARKPVDYSRRVLFGNYAAFSEHFRVRDTARNILFKKALVEFYGRIEVVRNLAHFTARKPLPKFSHIFTLKPQNRLARFCGTILLEFYPLFVFAVFRVD